MKKAIIWGHKLHSHTHSYVHYGYFKAFKQLGFDTYWFDNVDNISNFDFNDCIFFTEGQVDQKIPLNKNSIYILHHCNINKYISNNCKILNLCNYVKKYCDQGKGLNYENSIVDKIDNLLYYDKYNLAIYQPWATDLLPEEIDLNNAMLYNDNLTDVNYIGTIYEDGVQKIEQFANTCRSNNKIFKLYTGVENNKNLELIKNSYISIDMRANWHIECGYLPCRIFKNISYGKITGTNSIAVAQAINEGVIYNSDPSKLFYDVKDIYSKMSLSQIQSAMLYIKENHTYINRVNNILKII